LDNTDTPFATMSYGVPTHNVLTQIIVEGEAVQFGINGAGTLDTAFAITSLEVPTHNLLTQCSKLFNYG
jgi:hypothetical protein